MPKSVPLNPQKNANRPLKAFQEQAVPRKASPKTAPAKISSATNFKRIQIFPRAPFPAFRAPPRRSMQFPPPPDAHLGQAATAPLFHKKIRRQMPLQRCCCAFFLRRQSHANANAIYTHTPTHIPQSATLNAGHLYPKMGICTSMKSITCP